jgi:hypothetical protein
MLCPDCHGKGLAEAPAGPDRLPGRSPCPGCGGAGVAHCCEGLQAQPGEGPTFSPGCRGHATRPRRRG